MGMNWRAGLQLASTGLRMDRERKREYERADREMAMPMAQLLAQQGMPIPDNIKNMMGPMTQQLMPYLEEAVRTGKQRELEDAITKYETQKNIDWLYSETEQEKPLSSEFKVVQDLTGYTPEQFRGLDPKQRMAIIDAAKAIKKNPFLEEMAIAIKGLQMNQAGLNIAKTKAEMEGTADLNKPIPPSQLPYFPGKPAGTKFKDVTGVVPLSPDQRKKLESIRNAREVAKTAYDMAIPTKLIWAKSPAETLVQRGQRGLGSTFALDPKAKEYEDYLDQNLPLMARFMGDVGNLALQEQFMQKKGFGDFRDVRTTAINKFNRIFSSLDRREAEITGEPVEEVKKRNVGMNPFLKGEEESDEGKTAVNPQTGHKIIKKNGKWVDMKTGEPIQ